MPDFRLVRDLLKDVRAERRRRREEGGTAPVCPDEIRPIGCCGGGGGGEDAEALVATGMGTKGSSDWDVVFKLSIGKGEE